MKNINPVGREPNKDKMNAYGCTCNDAIGNYAKVSGQVPCNVCAYSCADGNTENRSYNEWTSQNRMTHT